MRKLGYAVVLFLGWFLLKKYAVGWESSHYALFHAIGLGVPIVLSLSWFFDICRDLHREHRRKVDQEEWVNDYVNCIFKNSSSYQNPFTPDMG